MSWDRNEKYVLATLKRLDAQHEEQLKRLEDIHAAIAGFKSDQKWEFRMLSGIWAILVTAINLSLKKFGI